MLLYSLLFYGFVRPVRPHSPISGTRCLPGRDVFSDVAPIAFLDRSNWKTDLGICVKGKFQPYDEEAELPENYAKTMSSIVSKKYDYCKNVLNTDYYGHLYDLGLLGQK